MSDDTHRLAREIAMLRRDLDALLRSSQLGRSSIEGGGLKVYDENGVLRHIIGEQADGTYTFTSRNGPAPTVTPSAPIVEANTYATFVAWDGLTDDGDLLPFDFASVEVYVSGAHMASIPSNKGSTVALPPSATGQVTLTIRNTSGAEGPASVPVST